MTIILLFPFLIFVGIVAAVLICRMSRRRHMDCVGASVAKPFSVLSVALAFDPDQAILWDTQVPALRLLASAGPKGLRLQRLHLWYLDSAGHYPELYDGYSFKEWLAFLDQSQLIVCKRRRVVLMPLAHELLHYWATVQSDIVWNSEFSNSDSE